MWKKENLLNTCCDACYDGILFEIIKEEFTFVDASRTELMMMMMIKTTSSSKFYFDFLNSQVD